MKDNLVYIVAAKRTAIGSFGGILKHFSATQLGGIAIEAAVASISMDKNKINEVIMGNVLQANLGQAPARQAAKVANLPDSTICTTVNKVCASGMKAVMMGTQAILLGDAEIVVAGGMENMSQVPFYNAHQRWGQKFGDTNLVDGMLKDGLKDVYQAMPMGCLADETATLFKISRAAQDAYAIKSYERSQAATKEGKYKNQITSIIIAHKNGEKIIDEDEEIFNFQKEKIPNLSPAFSKNGTITAANASKLSDGAAAMVLISKEKAAALNLKPLAVIRAYADAEQDPTLFTTTPNLAILKALKKAKLSIEQIDYFEINEAFSVVALANAEILKIPLSKINIWGGAVALGHPLGCSGARIILNLIEILRTEKKQYGVAAICNGGGGASAIVIENPCL